MFTGLGIVAYFLILVGTGFPFVRFLRYHPAIQILSSFVIGSSIIGLIMYTLAETGQLYSGTVYLVLTFFLLVTIAFSRPLLVSLREMMVAFIDIFPNDRGKLWFPCGAIFLFLWLILLASTPPRSADAMRYHLAQVKDIVQHHELLFRPYFHYNFPLYFSLTFLPVYIIFQGVGLQFCVLGFFLISIFCTLSIANRVQIKHSRLLFFLLVLTPVSYHKAHIVANDWVVIGYITIGVMLLTYRIDSSWVGKKDLIAFLSLGFSLGIKYHAILFLPWFILLQFSSLSWSAVKRCLISLSVCFAIASPFYLRNFIHTGDPFWPLLQDIFASNHDYLYQVTTNYAKNLQGQHSLLAIKNALQAGILFPQIPFVLWVLAFLGIIFGKKTPLRIGWGILFFFVFWWLIQPKPHWRFSMYILPMALISSVSFYQSTRVGIIRYATQIVLVIVFIYGIGIGVLYSQGYITYFFHQNIKQYHRATWFYTEYDWINQHLPKDAQLLVIVTSGHTYYLDRKYLRADPFLSGLIDWSIIENVEVLQEKLFSLGIDYLFYEETDWGNYPGGKQMMDIIEEYSQSPFCQIIWRQETSLCTSRIRNTYRKSSVVLIKILPSER